jgi:hypothetical protein
MADPCQEDRYHPQSYRYPPEEDSAFGGSGPTLRKEISAAGQAGPPCGPAWSTTPWAYLNRLRGLYFPGHFPLRTSAETITLVVTLLAHGRPLYAIVIACGLEARTFSMATDRFHLDPSGLPCL